MANEPPERPPGYPGTQSNPMPSGPYGPSGKETDTGTGTIEIKA
jgi:hypothetical protein